MTGSLTLGPIYFHWPAETLRDFYFRIADEAPVDDVYLGEAICAKRIPFFDDYYDAVTERLEKAGKTVIHTTLSEVTVAVDRRAVKKVCTTKTGIIEVNDASAFAFIKERPHRIGALFNCYNVEALRFLAAKGATHVALPAELRAPAVAAMAAVGHELGVGIEVQVYGRVSLALSARCYHARAHDRVKDNCRFVCENDPDGLDLDTLDGRHFLTINGIQTLSQRYLNMAHEVAGLRAARVTHFRLSPQSADMVGVARVFRDLLDARIDSSDADSRLAGLHGEETTFCNGFYHAVPGHERVAVEG